MPILRIINDFCLPEICQQFPPVQSGSYTMETNGTTSYIEVQCATGYYLDGDAVVTCSGDGTWSHTPSCCKLHYMKFLFEVVNANIL